ncbi:MAG: ATP synthase subunit I [Dehalococcoidia bacterium]|nr:ATP synthase subunit I [Dehalococcoidia bacterium]
MTAITTSYDGPSPAIEIARDLVRRGVYVAPILIAIGAAIWGTDGAASVAYACAIVLVNFALSAVMLGMAARISFALMAGAALFGFAIRLGLIFVAVYLVRNASWINMVALGVTIIVTHLGLLLWELRFVSGSLAYPGLKPRPSSTSPQGDR